MKRASLLLIVSILFLVFVLRVTAHTNHIMDVGNVYTYTFSHDVSYPNLERIHISITGPTHGGNPLYQVSDITPGWSSPDGLEEQWVTWNNPLPMISYTFTITASACLSQTTHVPALLEYTGNEKELRDWGDRAWIIRCPKIYLPIIQ